MRTLPFDLWRVWLVCLLALGLVAFLAFRELPDDKLHVWFLDIGQGDATLINTPENHQILIDGGDGELILEKLGEVMPFFDRSLDLVVLTHPHLDHLGGLVEVFNKYEVENVLLTGVNNRSGAYNEFLEKLIGKKTNFLIAEHLKDLNFGTVYFDVLYPFDQLLLEDFDNLNNSSIVMKLIYKDTEILFTGDIELETENFILENHVNLEADVLKVAHHGSHTSSSLDFLVAVRPEIAVIEVGEGNSYGHPDEKTLQNLSAVDVKEVYRTDKDGTIELVF